MALKRILITGAGGFVGENLVKSMAALGWEVFALQRSECLSTVSGVHYLIEDLTAHNWESSLPKVEVICHLAQSKQYRDPVDGTSDMYAINVHSTFRLLEWAKTNSVERFFFASTGNVYKPGKQVFDTGDELYPTSYYAASKLCAELLVKEYHRFFRPTVGRFFSVFGPGQQDMMLPNLAKRIKNGDQVTLAQSKGIVLTPIHVDQVIDLLKSLFEAPKDALPTHMNLAGPEVVDLGAIAKGIADFYGVDLNQETPNSAPGRLCGISHDPFQSIKQWKSALDFSTYLEK